VAARYLGLNAKRNLVPKRPNDRRPDIPTVADYCGMDVYTFGLVPKFRRNWKVSEKLHQLLLKVELPLEPVLAKME